jgi:uncharacterized membrane protein
MVIIKNIGNQIKSWYKKRITRFISSYFLQKYYKSFNIAKIFCKFVLLYKKGIMKFVLKYCGIWILLIGELFLIIPFFLKNETNTTLAMGLTLVIIGSILYVILNKKIPAWFVEK